jgi:hypothetical protein
MRRNGRFVYPEDPLAYLRTQVPRGALKWFTRVGIGMVIQCGACGAKPPSHMKWSYQRWRWLAGHDIEVHHGKERPDVHVVGGTHGVERSRERKRAA